eukprot:2579811-Pyramimonas_sp.AAC.1
MPPQILNISEKHGMDFQSFFDLLQRVGEEKVILLGLCRPLKPLLSELATEEFDSPVSCSQTVSTTRAFKPLLSELATEEFDSPVNFSRTPLRASLHAPLPACH